MKRKYKRIGRLKRLESIQNLIFTIDDALLVLIEDEFITVPQWRKDIINTVINYLGDAGVLKPEYNPPYYLQHGYYTTASDMTLKDNTFISKPETEY